MNSVWFAGLLPLLLAAAPQQARQLEARRRRPRAQQHPGRSSIPGSIPTCA